MTIAEWLKQSSAKIARLDAELILVDFLSVSDRSHLVSHADDELSNTAQIDAQVDRRAAGEPLAYILGQREFYGRNFFVTPDVLIPRPETETIIDIAKRLKPASILDIGTGSGCIAITLSLELPEAAVNAVDVSDDALRIAQKNAAHHGARVQFHKSNLLNDCKPEPGTLIIANLPYVDREWDWLDHQSLDHEPSLALYAEQGGLALIYQLIDQYPKNCSGLILEADTSQHDAIINYAREHGLELVERQGFILYFK